MGWLVVLHVKIVGDLEGLALKDEMQNAADLRCRRRTT